jgi:glycosyltransferase involved in cell wall biosynthesis
MKALFLTHPDQLRSTIDGGVQLCSQEFHTVIENIPGILLQDYHVPFTRDLSQRAAMKLGLENYSMYDVGKDAPALIEHIRADGIRAVFINMASMVRYARPIKEAFGDKVKTVLLSHGNHSGDFLHLITKPVRPTGPMKSFLDKLRLGLLISTEAEHRVRYLDAVVTLSETERQIENWFGATKTVFLPRRLSPAFLNHRPVPGRIGFVGRLDHPPNSQGLRILLDSFTSGQRNDLEFRLVGAPAGEGMKFEKEYPGLKYLGELDEATLEEEVSSWAFLLNPVWWYSTGASTKLAKAIGWGVPIATTTAGMRGYEWREGELLKADNPEEMATLLWQESRNPDRLDHWSRETRKAAVSGLSDRDLALLVKECLT